MVWYHDGVSLRLLWRCCARGPYAQQAAKLCTGMSVVTIYNNNNNNSSFDLPRKIMCVVLYVSFLRAFPVVGVCARGSCRRGKHFSRSVPNRLVLLLELQLRNSCRKNNGAQGSMWNFPIKDEKRVPSTTA